MGKWFSARRPAVSEAGGDSQEVFYRDQFLNGPAIEYRYDSSTGELAIGNQEVSKVFSVADGRVFLASQSKDGWEVLQLSIDLQSVSGSDSVRQEFNRLIAGNQKLREFLDVKDRRDSRGED